MQEPKLDNNINVLVVDDDPDAVANLQSLLSQLGYTAFALVDPLKAVDLAKTRRFDAAVLDYRMPGLDGIQLCHMLKAVNPRMSVALHSAFLPEECNSANNPCNAKLLNKPLDLSALISFVEGARYS